MAGNPNVERTPEQQNHMLIRPYLTSLDAPMIWKVILQVQGRLEPDSHLSRLLDEAHLWDIILQKVSTNPRYSKLTAQIIGCAQVSIPYI